MDKEIRKSVIAGNWYPGSPKVLRADIEDFFLNAPDVMIDGSIRGLIVPHAGYIYSGQIAAIAYKIIKRKIFDAVLVLGPSHRAFFHGVSIYDRGGYETPLGVVPVDVTLANDIMAQSEMISYMPAAHSQEHSLEIQLPFLQVALGEFRFVPLIMGEQDLKTCENLAESIVNAINGRNVLIVGSSDLSHFHSYEKAVKLDSAVIKRIEKMDGRGLLEDLEKNLCEACGGGPALEHLTHLRADALELVEPLLLDFERDELDIDAGQMIGQRLAPDRFRPRMGPHGLGRGGRRTGPAEERGEEGERQLTVVGRQALGLLAEEPPLELLVGFDQAEVEGAVLVALRLGARQRLLEGGEARHQRRRVRHRRSLVRHGTLFIR
jgi:AmmeMemoRadiSam system protein B